MTKTVTFTDFCDSFTGSYTDQFSYEGKRALFDYLEEYEDASNQQIELDTVALACEYTEYDSANECAKEYFAFEGMTFADDGSELETANEVEAKALGYLEERTRVISCENGHVIVAEF